MRKNLASSLSEADQVKLFRLGVAMAEYEDTNDPIHKQRLSEEILELKKDLIRLIPEFKNITPMVAGDKDVERCEFVVCADATVDSFRVKGTIEVPCSKCGTTVLLSPDSPTKPPKICFDCATKIAEQRNLDDSQESFGA